MAKAESAPFEEHSGNDLEPISVRIPEACRLTGIGRSKLYQLIGSGDLETVKIGAMTLVPLNGLRDLIERARRGDRGREGP